MLAIDIHAHARRLLETHGTRALAEAAQKARLLEERGRRDEATTWRRIEAALRELRGPHVS